MRGQLPNALSGGRLVLALLFFIILSAPDAALNRDAMIIATCVFVLAAATDAVDGYLARRWNVISIFGRVMDPLADKVLVLGAFIMLAGPGFEIAGRQMSGVAPWMVIVMLARELLVTSIRGVCEARGIDFSATLPGKLKMILQSIAVPTILIVLIVGLNVRGLHIDGIIGAQINHVIAWVVTVVTAWSALPYIMRAWHGLSNAEMHP